MPTWPGELPQSPQYDGYSELMPDLLLRTEMDAGPAKVRKRFTAGVTRFTMAFLMTGAQVEDFEDFFNTDLDGGVNEFDFTHPRLATVVSLRLTEPPAIQAKGPDTYLVALKVEMLP